MNQAGCGHSPGGRFCHDSAQAFALFWHRTGKGIPLLLARRFAAAKALSLIAGALFVLVFSAADSRAGCEDGADLAVLPSPLTPWKGAPLRVILADEKPFDGELSLIAPDGSVAAKSREVRGGPPYFWFAEVGTPANQK